MEHPGLRDVNPFAASHQAVSTEDLVEWISNTIRPVLSQAGHFRFNCAPFGFRGPAQHQIVKNQVEAQMRRRGLPGRMDLYMGVPDANGVRSYYCEFVLSQPIEVINK